MDRINGFSGGLAVPRFPAIGGKTKSNTPRVIDSPVAGTTVTNSDSSVNYFSECSINTTKPSLEIKQKSPYSKQAELSNRGYFRFTNDTVFYGATNRKGSCSIWFHAHISSIQSKRERNQWLNHARSSIRASGINKFAKIMVAAIATIPFCSLTY